MAKKAEKSSFGRWSNEERQMMYFLYYMKIPGRPRVSAQQIAECLNVVFDTGRTHRAITNQLDGTRYITDLKKKGYI